MVSSSVSALDILQNFKFVVSLFDVTNRLTSLSSTQWGEIPYQVATVLLFSPKIQRNISKLFKTESLNDFNLKS